LAFWYWFYIDSAMLKIWKQTWRGEDKDGLRTEHENSNEQIETLTGQPVSESVSNLDTEGSDANVQAITHALPPTMRYKRTATDAMSNTVTPPAKKAKTDSEYPDLITLELPTELVVFFDRLSQIPLTPLYQKLHQADKQEAYLRRYFSAARHVLVEVGACASDLVWRRAAGEIEASIVDPDEDEEPDPSAEQTKERLSKLEVLNTIKHWDFSMPNLDSSSRGFNVTPKFLKLAQILKSCQPYGDSLRVIVIGMFKFSVIILASFQLV
jgi:endoribonuclease Dicer